MSFAQLVRTGKTGTWAQQAHIRDYPDIEYRWGMGRKVDGSLRWKMNLTPYVWIYERFNAETSGNLDVNRYGRERLVPRYRCDFYES